jgi:hypothetical protein
MTYVKGRLANHQLDAATKQRRTQVLLDTLEVLDKIEDQAAQHARWEADRRRLTVWYPTLALWGSLACWWLVDLIFQVTRLVRVDQSAGAVTIVMTYGASINVPLTLLVVGSGATLWILSRSGRAQDLITRSLKRSG